MEKEYKNVGWYLAVLVFLVALGFYKPYFGLFPHFGSEFTLVVHVHATALILWVLLLVVQPVLVLRRKLAAHRLLGKFTYGLVPLIVVTSAAMMHKQYEEGIAQHLTGGESLKALIIPAGELLSFSLFYGLAIFHRRRVALHMRYMICTALVLITPSLARVTGFWFNVPQLRSYIISFSVSDLLLIGLILFDRRHALNYRPYVVALAIFLAFHAGWYISGHPY